MSTNLNNASNPVDESSTDLFANDANILKNEINELKKQLEDLKKLKSEEKKEIEKSVFDVAKQQLDAEKTAKELAKQEILNESFVADFDNKFGGLVGQENLAVINSANTTDQHKAVAKFVKIFEKEENKKLLPPILKPKVEAVLSMNDTQLANYNDIANIQDVLNNFVAIKTNFDLSNSRFLGNKIPKKETIAESKWKEAIAKANGNIMTNR